MMLQNTPTYNALINLVRLVAEWFSEDDFSK